MIQFADERRTGQMREVYQGSKVSINMKPVNEGRQLLNIFFCRTNPEGYTRQGVIDIPHLFLLGMGSTDQRRAMKSEADLRSTLGNMIDDLPKDIDHVLQDPMEAFLLSLRLTQTIYFDIILSKNTISLDILSTEIGGTKDKMCVLSLVQLIQVFQGSRYALDIKRKLGQANFYRAAFSGDLSCPVFSEYYLHHYCFHKLPAALNSRLHDLETFFKCVYNMWNAADLNDDQMCEKTADHLGRVIMKLEALASIAVVSEALNSAISALSQAYGDRVKWSHLLNESASPAPSWLDKDVTSERLV